MSRYSISYKTVIKALNYDPLTGEFRWNSSRPKIRIGDIAGGYNDQGYIIIRLNRKGYRAHRLAFFIYNKRWPVGCIDHINSKRDDNRIANLREATKSQNGMNASKRSHNTSGYKGVVYIDKRNVYHARITLQGRQHFLGSFDTAEHAAVVYLAAAWELFGEFAFNS